MARRSDFDRHIEREPTEYPCGICGKLPDDCICPECPVCHAFGDPRCYSNVSPPGHGLTVSPEQAASRMEYEAALAAEIAADAAATAAYAADVAAETRRAAADAMYAALARVAAGGLGAPNGDFCEDCGAVMPKLPDGVTICGPMDHAPDCLRLAVESAIALADGRPC